MSELLASLLPPPKYGLTQVLGPYGWVGVVSYVVAALATPLLRALARRLKIVDKPDGYLKPHARPIAYLGGVAIYLGWVAGLLMLLAKGQTEHKWVLGLGLSGGVVLAVGLADDLRNIRPALKLLGQTAAAGILLAFGIGRDIVLVVFRPLHVPCPEWLVLVLSAGATVFLVVAASNAANLLDGIDGLCSGVTGIISVMFLALATHLAMYAYSEPRDPVRIAASLAMVGAVCGFLPYNFAPATIFLGDAGSMLLGLFAAAMMLMFGERGVVRWVLGAVMIFGLPILDTSMALLRRIRLRHPIFAGDRSHLYDQLVDRGFTVNQTLAISYGLSAFYGVMGLCIILVRTRYALTIYAVVAVMTLYLCHRWGFLRPAETPRERAAGGVSDP
ncbi:MAG: hypothetical protein AMJ81_09890 [Phycisphaerae bacterium SM23_33]|nr:MAG: hypothetical protein AMJ81_09890 [Phycisphaerae bacterium SM23_33]